MSGRTAGRQKVGTPVTPVDAALKGKDASEVTAAGPSRSLSATPTAGSATFSASTAAAWPRSACPGVRRLTRS
jgi:hypothetical protein